jgi:dolichol kinase
LVLLVTVYGSAELMRFVLIGGAIVAVLVDSVRITQPAFGMLVKRMVPVFRASESTRLSGATWLCVGYAAAAWFPHPAAAGGILAGAFADPAASWAGSMFAEPSSLKKTWVGSLAAAVAAALVLFTTGIPLTVVVSGAVAALALERWPGPLNDNLTVAPGVALVVWLLL